MAAIFIGWVSYMYWPIGVSAKEDQDAGDQADQGSHLEGALEEIHVLFADEVIGADTQDQEGWPSQNRPRWCARRRSSLWGCRSGRRNRPVRRGRWRR